MDPNVCLAHIRDIVKNFDRAPNDEARASLGSELVDYVNSMDMWLSQGAYLPEAWNKA